MTIQLAKVKPSKTNQQITVSHDTKNRSKQYFRDINVHHQYILNLIK